MRELMNSMAFDGIELCPFRLVGHGLRERIGFGHADRFVLIEHKDTVWLQCCQFSDRLRIAGSDFRRCGRSGFLTRSRRLAGRSGLSGLRLDVGEAEVCSEVCSGAAGGRGHHAAVHHHNDGDAFACSLIAQR